MKVKIILISLFMLFYSACNNDDKKEDLKEENVVKEEKFNKLINFSLSFYKSDELFSIKRISNENKDLEFKNNEKAIMFYFFTTWCPACIAELPHLNALAEKYKDELDIIGVLLDDRADDIIDNFISKNNINFKLSYGDNNFTFLKVLDNVDAIPYTALYNKNGKNINNYKGIVYEEMLEIDILKAIK